MTHRLAVNANSLMACCFGPRRLLAAVALMLCASPAPALEGTEAAPLTPDQHAIIEKLGKPPGGDDTRYAPAPSEAIGAKFRLPLGDGKYVTLVRRDSATQKDGSVYWRGDVEETGEHALLMLWGNALLTGYFVYNGTIYTVENLGGGVHAFTEMNRQKLPGDHPSPAPPRDSVPTAAPEAPPRAPPEPKVARFPDAERAALEAKHITIDLMVLYTSAAAKHYVRAPSDLLALAVEETNATFRNSGIDNVTLRLVHTQQIDYDSKTADQFTDLYTMVDGLGPFKDVRRLRDEKRADIVGLIIDNPNGCGLSTRIGPDSDQAFFVVHHACAATTMSIAHEIGHILGARHDRFIDQSDQPLAYGHGYVNGTRWRDIMSYKEGCGGCPRIPFWSNPRVAYKGEPTGTDAADNARLILELAERVSKFR